MPDVRKTAGGEVMCEYCEIKKGEKEGEPCGDMWLEKSVLGWRLLAPIGESNVFYCPWCWRELEEK